MLSSSSHVSLPRCSMLFNDTNYPDWVLQIRLYMRGLWLWDFLTRVLPCPACSLVPASPMISDQTTEEENRRVILDHEDAKASFEAQFTAYKTWQDEDARACSILVTNMHERFASDVIGLDIAQKMRDFLHQRYEPTRQSTFLAAIRQEQAL